VSRPTAAALTTTQTPPAAAARAARVHRRPAERPGPAGRLRGAAPVARREGALERVAAWPVPRATRVRAGLATSAVRQARRATPAVRRARRRARPAAPQSQALRARRVGLRAAAPRHRAPSSRPVRVFSRRVVHFRLSVPARRHRVVAPPLHQIATRSAAARGWATPPPARGQPMLAPRTQRAPLVRPQAALGPPAEAPWRRARRWTL
jgi:hypothetical protein